MTKHLCSLFIFILLIAGVWAFFAYDFDVALVKSYASPTVNYDSHADAGSASRFPEFHEPVDADSKDVTIHFKMMANAIGQYDNVFQTSDINNGIRLEFNVPDKLFLVQGGDNIGVVQIPEPIELHKWYAFTIHLHKLGRLDIVMDGVAVAKATVIPSAVHLDHTVVGAGFSASRKFDGRIEDFSISYKLFSHAGKKIAKAHRDLRLFVVACLVLILLLERSLILRLLHRMSLPCIRGCKALRNRTLSRDQKISILITMIVVGFVSITYYFYYCALMLKLPFPDNTFLPGPDARFGDFLSTVSLWSATAFKGVGMGLSYFPGTYLIVDFFSWFYNPANMVSFMVFTCILFGFSMAYVFVSLRDEQAVVSFQRAFVCSFMTYPMLFTFHTGNLELFVLIFLVLFIALYQRGRFGLSTIPLGFAVSMKLIPAVFLVLFIADKKYKQLFYACMACVFFMLLPLLIFPGGIWDGFHGYLERLHASQKMYFDLMIISVSGQYYGHSLINSARILAGSHFPPMENVLLPYLLFSLLCYVLVSAYIVFVEEVMWKKVALVVICLCLLPYTSSDYKLLHFFIPLFLFINVRDNGARPAKYDLLYLILFALLIIPKNYFGVRGYMMDNINSVFNTAIMIILLVTIIGSGIRDNGWQRGCVRMKSWFKTGA